jgi:hypothetical protein
VNFNDRFTRLDPDMPLEQLSFGGAVAFILGTIFLRFFGTYPSVTEVGFLLASVALFLSIVRAITDCTYFMDNEERILCYSFAILGKGTTYKVCDFSDITRVGIHGQKTLWQQLKILSYYDKVYAVVFEINGEVCFHVSEDNVSKIKTVRSGVLLAEHIGCPFLNPESLATSLESNSREVPKKEIKLKWASWNDLSNPGTKEFVLFAAALVAFFVHYYE